jgi:hypothetical protein
MPNKDKNTDSFFAYNGRRLFDSARDASCSYLTGGAKKREDYRPRTSGTWQWRAKLASLIAD